MKSCVQWCVQGDGNQQGSEGRKTLPVAEALYNPLQEAARAAADISRIKLEWNDGRGTVKTLTFFFQSLGLLSETSID